ncbi:MAG: ABC transporter permease [Oscillospiraceae bacterium]|nr:ABC transporter permease [Oscillospiraceae bacterium]
MREHIRHKGRLAQTSIYLGKFLRMFVYQNDWKVLPMGAAIAAVVTFVVGKNLFVYQEGTLTGTFALVCVCIWNGFFNSIQVVCRERDIVKREHRAGLYMSAYIGAHMIYQLLLCAAQTAVTLLICRISGVMIPETGIITSSGMIDIAITLFLITYTSDMMALMVSCIVRTTTTAMTVMPFLLIFQLVFSGGFFGLTGFAKKISVLTISRWGLNSLCAIGRYNEQPMVTLWNTLFKFRYVEMIGETPLLDLIQQMERDGTRDEFLQWAGTYNQDPAYASTVENVLLNWGGLLLILIVCVIAAIIALQFIDRDKR